MLNIRKNMRKLTRSQFVFVMGSVGMFFFMSFVQCSRDDRGSQTKLSIPVNLNYLAPTTYRLDESNQQGLELVATATNLSASLTGCSSSLSFGTTLLRASYIQVFLGDTNCLLKLQSYVIGSTTYSATATGATNFTTWTVGSVATFANTTLSTDTMKVFVGAQLTQTGILSTDTVVYNFTESTAAPTQNLSTATVSFPVPLSVSGQTPNFTFTQVRELSVNANGSFNVSFTLQCAVPETGATGPTYACSGAILQSQLDYIFIADAYSQGTITSAQAATAFTANTPTAVGTLTVAPGGTDLNGNTLPNGGFYTSNSTPLVTGTTAVYPSNYNYVFMLRQKDAFGNVLGYMYAYVDFPPTPGIAGSCGAYFASGSGTVGSPYVVNSAQTLMYTTLCQSSSIYFIQTATFDLGGSSTPWVPIPLYGQYNGNGFSITGLYVNNATASANDGLFTTINTGASVSNLTISSASVTSAGTNIGILAGSSSGSITGVTVSGTVATQGTIATTVIIGSLVGNLASGGTITTSTSTANVTWGATTLTGTTVRMGGLVGNTSGTSITLCSYVGTITATQRVGTFVLNAVGGLVGSVTAGSVSQNYAIATMSVDPNTSLGPQDIGGLVGQTAASITLSQNYASGSMTVTRVASSAVYSIGGMVGLAGATSTIINSYTMVTMSVTTARTSDFYGGFVGKAVAITDCYSANPTMSTTQGNAFGKSTGITGTITTSYYDSIAGLPTQGAITGLSAITPANIATQGSFTGFDFATPIWRMPSANPLASPNTTLSPVLNWQCGSNGITCI